VSAQSFKCKNAKKASLYSAIIPGAGQIYTEKYWKIPIIYSGLIASAYYIKQNNDQYKLYRSTYLNRINNDNNTDQFQGEYSNQDLVTLTDFYRRNREVSTLLFTLTYLLNIIDASVSAHLFSFDVSEDLSMNIKPIYFMHSKSSGIQLSFNL
jgi:hypothetical protein